jgi:prevent-host-death family protein
MKTLNVHEAKAQFSSLLDDVQHGEEIVIARYGKPIAKIVSLEQPEHRSLGFHPIDFKSDLLAPTEEDIIAEFEGH